MITHFKAHGMVAALCKHLVWFLTITSGASKAALKKKTLGGPVFKAVCEFARLKEPFSSGKIEVGTRSVTQCDKISNIGKYTVL